MTAAVADRDVRLHATVCAHPAPAWSATCGCGCVAVRHEDASHKQMPSGPGRTCTGRNLAGRCRDCACPAFNPTDPKENAHV